MSRIDARRKAVYPYFKRLEESRNAEEERKAVEAMAAWAKDLQDGEDGYKFRVEKGSVRLSSRDLSDLAAKDQPVTLHIECPCFPPATPWMEYRFEESCARAGHRHTMIENTTNSSRIMQKLPSISSSYQGWHDELHVEIEDLA